MNSSQTLKILMLQTLNQPTDDTGCAPQRLFTTIYTPGVQQQFMYEALTTCVFSHLGEQTWPEGLHGDSCSLDQSVQLVLLQTQKTIYVTETTANTSATKRKTSEQILVTCLICFFPPHLRLSDFFFLIIK